MVLRLTDTIQITCKHCKTKFSVDIWLVLNPIELPELAEKVCDGTIHQVICPICNSIYPVDAPLLLYLPNNDPPIIFSPASYTSPEQTQQQAIELLAWLKQQLADRWQDNLLGSSLVVTRDRIREHLSICLEKDSAELHEGSKKSNRKTGLNIDLPNGFDQIYEKIILLRGLSKNNEEKRKEYIQFLEDTLTTISAEHYAALRAILLCDLATAYMNSRFADRAQYFTKAITLLEETLRIIPADLDPRQQAITLNELGNAYFHNPSGDRTRNLQKAIDCYRKSLEFFTFETASNQYATLQNNLGAALTNLQVGNRIDYLKEAIACYQKALEVINPEESPADFARTHTNLGNAYQNMPSGNPVENSQLALEHYEEALKWITIETAPQQYALLQNNLGNLWLNISTGVRETNVRKAIECFKEALCVFQPDTQPDDYAMAQNNLGNAYYDLPLGPKAENLQNAINCYQEALRFRSADTTPYQYANTLSNLGVIYSDLPTGNPIENSNQAISFFQDALKIRTPELYPYEYAATQMNLGAVYDKLPFGNPQENFQKAKTCYEEASRFLKPETTPFDYANLMSNLGNAFRNMLTGDRLDNLKQAIAYYEESLRFHDPEKFPFDYARTQNNLGTAYYDYMIGDRPKQLQKAISCFKEALRFRKQEVVPLDYARTSSNLGSAYAELAAGQLSNYLNEAIHWFEQALSVFTVDAAPFEYALNQNNLGNAYRLLYQLSENNETFWSKAYESFQEALKIYRTGGSPYEQARTQLNMGQLYSLHSENTDDIETAIQSFQSALEIYTPITIPLECRRAARMLAQLHERLKQWDQARIAYRLALQAAAIQYRYAFHQASQKQEIGTNEELYMGMVRSCINGEQDSGAIREAFLAVEAAKARTFLEQLGQTDFPKPAGVSPDWAEKEELFLANLRSVDQALLAPQLSIDEQDRLARLRNQARHDLEKHWGNIESLSEQAQEYLAIRRGNTPSWQDIEDLIQAFPLQSILVEFFPLEDEIVVFLLKPNWEGPVIVRLPISKNRLYYRYLAPYLEEMIQPVTGRPRTGQWMMLGEELLKPVKNYLVDVNLVYLVPYGLLHLLPIHCLILNGKPLIENYQVCYAPSAGSLDRILRRTRQNKSDLPALVFGYTPSESEKEQNAFLGEANEIALMFGVTAISGHAATPQVLSQLAPKASWIHLSCHGNYQTQDPLSSQVTLYGGSFTARDWMKLALNAELITLSACQTGIQEISQGDEIMGFPRALFYAGTRTTLLTLWKVDAEATKIWMTNFYHALKECQPGSNRKAAAFQQATLALKEKYPAPYYWAPFMLIGDAN